MLEVIIDRWSKAGKTDYLWSIWRDGKRIYQGSSHNALEEAEQDAREFCRRQLRQEPDKITPL